MSASFMERARLWLRANIFRRRYEQEMRDEMAAHLDKATKLLMARGLSEDDARKQARREFGDVAYHQTEGRDARGTLWLDALLADARFALRHFARKPVATLVMFIILVVGMSIASLLFSFVHSMAYQPPPAVAYQKDLVRIRGMDGKPGDMSPRAFEQDEWDAIKQLSQFSSVAGWIDSDAAFLTPDNPDRRAVNTRVNFVTNNYFDVLGVPMAAGPGLPRDDASRDRAAVVVISYQTWKDLFQQRANAIGSQISLNGVPVTIVGVAAEHFTGVYGQTRLQVWVPMAAQPMIAPRAEINYRAFGRLRPGVTVEQASAAVSAIAARAGTLTPERRKIVFSGDAAVMLSANIDPSFNDVIRLQFVLVGSLALLILLVTCTNVSALLTGLAAARRQEIAIRLSLGAARGRIIRQLLTESAFLAILAGIAALGVVKFAMHMVLKLLPNMPITVGITWSLTTFTFAIALAVGVAFGLSPALHATRMALANVLRDASRGGGKARARMQQGLVVAQIAFTQPLVVALAGLVVLVLSTMQPRVITDSGDRVLSLNVQATANSVKTDDEQRALMNRLLQGFQSTPGVASAVIDYGPARGWGKYSARDATKDAGVVDLAVKQVAPDYFKVLDVHVTRGRTFGREDSVTIATKSGAVPVIIDSKLAAALWRNADPVGRRFTTMIDTATTARELVVVGVVDDPSARARLPQEAPVVYVPTDMSGAPQQMLIHTTSAGKAFLPTIRDVVNREAPGAVADVNTLAGLADQERANLRLVYGGISAASAIALLLAAIGLYAVVAFSVAQRTHEIAVRLSVGARGAQIARAFIGDGLRLSAIGMVIGLPLSLAALKFGLNPRLVYPVSLSPVAVIAAFSVIVVAAAATWIPARRAAAVDPAQVLRNG